MKGGVGEIRSLFKSFSGVEQLKKLFEGRAPSAVVNWDAKDISLELSSVQKKLRETNPPEHFALMSVLQDIDVVCRDKKTPERLAETFKDPALKQQCLDESGGKLHDMVAWIMLNEDEAWQHLVSSSVSASIVSGKWEDYRIKHCDPPANITDLITDFKNSLELYLRFETLHGDNTNIEYVRLDDIVRYTININNFPVNVPQFKENGAYQVGPNTNAVNIILEHHLATDLIRIKCGFDIQKRREIVRQFCESVLKTELASDESVRYDLISHLSMTRLPVSAEKYGADVKRTGIKVSFVSNSGNRVTILVTCDDEDYSLKMLEDLIRKNGNIRSVIVEEVHYQIMLPRIGGAKSKNSAILKPDGIHPLSRDPKNRDIVLRLMEECL